MDLTRIYVVEEKTLNGWEAAELFFTCSEALDNWAYVREQEEGIDFRVREYTVTPVEDSP